MPIRTLHLNQERGIEVFTKGGETTVSSLDVRELKSIWNYGFGDHVEIARSVKELK